MSRVTTFIQGVRGGFTGHDDLHIIDQLILERATELSRLKVWPLIKPLLFRMFGYHEAVTLADAINQMSGTEAFAYLCRVLEIEIAVKGIEHIPTDSGFILAPNHPTGLADGLAVFKLLQDVRPDMSIFTNRDAVRICSGFRDIVIPVEWREDQKSFAKNRDTLSMTTKAFAEERAIVLFPSGRIAFWSDDRLTERPWRTSAVALARKYDVPIVPMGITSRNSGLFYLLSRYHDELRDMMLFHELINKKGAPIKMNIGTPVLPSELDSHPEIATEQLKHISVSELAGM